MVLHIDGITALVAAHAYYVSGEVMQHSLARHGIATLPFCVLWRQRIVGDASRITHFMWSFNNRRKAITLISFEMLF